MYHKIKMKKCLGPYDFALIKELHLDWFGEEVHAKTWNMFFEPGSPIELFNTGAMIERLMGYASRTRDEHEPRTEVYMRYHRIVNLLENWKLHIYKTLHARENS